jgi:hypothetical protein
MRHCMFCNGCCVDRRCVTGLWPQGLAHGLVWTLYIGWQGSVTQSFCGLHIFCGVLRGWLDLYLQCCAACAYPGVCRKLQ